MSAWSIALLGAFAGLTIFLGLPFGRVRNPSLGLRVILNGAAIGILLFLLWDVLLHAVEPVEQALTEATDGQSGSWGRFIGLAAHRHPRGHLRVDEPGVLQPVDGQSSSSFRAGCRRGRRIRGGSAAHCDGRRPATGVDDRGWDRVAQLL